MSRVAGTSSRSDTVPYFLNEWRHMVGGIAMLSISPGRCWFVGVMFLVISTAIGVAEVRPDPCRICWQGLPKGIDWGVIGPARWKKNGKIGQKRLDVGDPLPVEVHIRNRRGVPKRMPSLLYRDAGKGGPAFRKGIKLCLARAPFDPRTPYAYYPRDNHYKPVKPSRSERFVAKDPGRLLKTGESFKAFTFDLRDWFKIDKPGYYMFHFEFDERDMNMPRKEYQGAAQVSFGFILGTPPKRLTFAELNKGVAPFGGKENENRLRRLIRETISPKPAKPSSSTSKPADRQPRKRAATLPFPDDFPKLSRIGFMGGNMSGMESDFTCLHISNRKLLSTLTKYDPAQVRQEFDKRMIAEKDLPMKLLLASVAASSGSEKAALFLLESMKDTDYHAVRNVHSALGYVFYSYGKKQPDWIVELVIASLSDRRYVTGLKKTNWSSETYFRISYLADEYGNLTYALGNVECRKAVPFLIEMAKRTKGRRGPITALGWTGDRRAIPMLMHFLKIGAAEVNHEETFLPDKFIRSANALASLKAKEAVPILLERIEYPDVIEALERIADPRIIGPFRELVSAKGKITRNGKSILPNLEQRRVAAAMIALAHLEEGDCVPRLCALLSEKSLSEFQRSDVVWWLGGQRDPRAIPYLIKEIKTDPDGVAADQAITVLAAFKHKAAVEGLIECFDADFKGKCNWKKSVYTLDMYRKNIAASLRKITGHDLGPDKKAWAKWWRNNSKVIK